MNNSLASGALLALLLALAGPSHAQGAAKGETIRPEVGKPLQAAQDLVKAQKPRDALAKVDEADAVAAKTPIESYLVQRVRASAAAAAGDVPAMIGALEAIVASGRLQQPEVVTMAQALAGGYYRVKDYPKAISWATRYRTEGGTDPQIRAVLIHSYYQSGAFDHAAQELLSDVQAEEKAGRAPSEESLRLLANSYLQMKDENRYAWALEKLVTYYPKKEYWADLIARTQKKSTFADRLALDILRLRLPTGNVEDADDYMELAESSLRAGYPAEAKKALDKGFASGVLGAGPQADRHKRMRDIVERQLAEDRRQLEGNAMELKADAQKDGGLALVDLGFAYVSNGQYDRGLALMERGMAKGAANAAVPNKKMHDSRLHLGIAYLMAGRKDKALQIFSTIDGVHGASDLGRLWAIHAR